MNNKTLGIIAIICAPFLYVDFLTSTLNVITWKTGLYGFIYMTGWLCSLIALQRLQVLGRNKFAKFAFFLQFTFLTLAQCWNIWVMIEPQSNHTLYFILDSCWPLSNIWMLVIGITAVVAKQLKGFKRYVPLLVGMWFPATVIPSITMGLSTLAGPYSAIAFILLGLLVYTSGNEERKEKDYLNKAYAIA